MTLTKLVLRNLLYHRRRHLLLLLGMAVATMVGLGALLVGNSVTTSLQRFNQERTGDIAWSLHSPPHHFFEESLAKRLQVHPGRFAAGIHLAGSASRLVLPTTFSQPSLQPTDHTTTLISNTALAAHVQIWGITPEWRLFFPGSSWPGQLNNHQIWISQGLANETGANIGDELILHIPVLSNMASEAPLSQRPQTKLLKTKIAGLVPDHQGGRLALNPHQSAPHNIFISLSWLQQQANFPFHSSNLLIAAPPLENQHTPCINPPITSYPAFQNAVSSQWQLSDMGLSLVRLDSGMWELRDTGVFISQAITKAAKQAHPQSMAILTYLVNRLELVSPLVPPTVLRSAPYSMVTAVEDAYIPSSLAENEIIINEWLAQNLAIQTKDYLQLRYFVLGPLRELQEKTALFQVAGIVPMTPPYLDPDLMPDFPGLKNVQDCMDWRPGIPVDLPTIRPSDRQYWEQYKGTPKAFIALSAGQKLWGNRFGHCTAIRYPASMTDTEIATALCDSISLPELGFQFQDWNAIKEKAQTPTVDFGQLFLGLSFFLIAAALLLIYLLLSLAILQRLGEFSILYYLGFSHRQIQGLVRWELGCVTLLGMVLGDFCAHWYAAGLLEWLKSLWPAAASLNLAPSQNTLEIWTGRIILFAIFLATCHAPIQKIRGNAVRLFFSELPPQLTKHSWKMAKIFWVCIAVMTLCIMFFFPHQDAPTLVMVFFISGFVWLCLGISGCYFWMIRPVLSKNHALATNASLATHTTKASLSASCLPLLLHWAWIGIIRNRRRSMTVVSLLSCGIFVVLVVGSSQQIPLQSHLPQSGTGGFSLYVETSTPIVANLNQASGRAAMFLPTQWPAQVAMIPIRSWDGDDASCQNLYQAQHPRVLGIPAAEFDQRHAFRFAKYSEHSDRIHPWLSLEQDLGSDRIPAIIDHNVMMWGLSKRIGDELEYQNQSGHTIRLKIIATLENSIFQGSILIAQTAFLRHFPQTIGASIWLVSIPDASASNLSHTTVSHLPNITTFPETTTPHFSNISTNVQEWQQLLTTQWQDWGANVEPCHERLARFLMVENAYLTIFLGLGGIGLILGSLGLGIVLLRNMEERQREWAVLYALGFSHRQLSWAILLEHTLLSAMGFVSGSLAAMIALIPSLLSRSHQIPWNISFTCIIFIFCSIAISLGIGIQKISTSHSITTWRE